MLINMGSFFRRIYVAYVKAFSGIILLKRLHSFLSVIDSDVYYLPTLVQLNSLIKPFHNPFKPKSKAFRKGIDMGLLGL